MPDVSITELIAEFRSYCHKNYDGSNEKLFDFLDALERVTVPSENERVVLARIIGGAVYGDRTNPSRATEAADEALAYGFRLPVPVERDNAVAIVEGFKASYNRNGATHKVLERVIAALREQSIPVPVEPAPHETGDTR